MVASASSMGPAWKREFQFPLAERTLDFNDSNRLDSV